MTRSDILETAKKKCVCGDREEDYGSPEDSFKLIASLWSDYLTGTHGVNRHFVDAADVAIMMALLKIARMAHGNKADNFVDLAGYAACAGEIATKREYWGNSSVVARENSSVEALGDSSVVAWEKA